MTDKAIALVTGASSGLGAEFCRQLAERCRKIILVGRRRALLEDVASSLREKGLETVVVAEDLTTELGLTEVVEKIRQQGPVTILVNNAGFGTNGPFVDTDLALQQKMVDLHISATLRLSRAVIPYMKEAGGGSIINLSSLGAFFPMKDIAVYVASKAFLNTFSESLQKEVARDNIRVQSLCPGFTHTDFHGRDEFDNFDKNSIPAEMWMTSEAVVTESLQALDAGEQVVFIAGEQNRAMVAGR
ncbi:SDR family NAD(P)-dependent oxidoreductase [Litorivivens sp.]|uniref:SDR family NAD(P)-dependent oxidoreductase n=1 Tax=Litorivivens sp. TaxID=2020868 RepID=UPI00356AB611